MPPYLAVPYFHLSKLPLTTKLALTGFYLSILSGVVFVAVVYFPKVLEPAREASKNFLQRDIGMIEAARPHFAPHEIDREVMEKGGESREEIDRHVEEQKAGQRRKAYDIIHPHSFLMPVVYFILCHLMEMTTISRGVRIGLYGAGFVGMMATIFAPLTVLHAPVLAIPTFALLYVMLICFAAMATVPAIHMWWIRPKP
jgi:hypothetical protein